ncbi:unnamed protein product [Rotaria sp. Silwood1]|nr:unnamed protein product [Rotaria sp. Silwood1]CAF1655900.1 unnamed protein product [Rotaria sp. Silwood1]CAF3510047.1 unnamed protein product [Rotaria sp. Silwood1]CAF4959711.1 unnamed protein product [Rotaria sp. Silwood1]CAF4983909.1 unnamed protein product [Rotaria sp. Silwood1]
MKQAATDNCQSIAFPAVGCGLARCDIGLVAQTMVREVNRQLAKYPLSVIFVIKPERLDIYDEFLKEIRLLQEPKQTPSIENISTTIGQGTIEIEKGNITLQKVDVIIGTSSSEALKKIIMNAAGDKAKLMYNTEYKKNPNSPLISIPSCQLACNRIFFIKWQPDKNLAILRKSITDFVSIVIQNTIAYQFSSIALPIIGCGQHGCPVNLMAKTMIAEIKKQLTISNVPMIVKFIVEPEREHVYQTFCKQIEATQEGNSTAVFSSANFRSVILGTSYGVGVYFSANANYSHAFAVPNAKGERHMFLSRVLIGKTCPGTSFMKMPPDGFHSTTDGTHIFVVYHDAQAYAEYLITYE